MRVSKELFGMIWNYGLRIVYQQEYQKTRSLFIERKTFKAETYGRRTDRL
jgi:hypothetical protein